ncbi:MAG: DNA gyrase inhibitor YacG [Terriglobia bacterium]
MKGHCPICHVELRMGKNLFRPFCSERCRMIDLDNWLAGRYRVSSPASAEPGNNDDANPGDASERDVE